jgi:hypothetical protein
MGNLVESVPIYQNTGVSDPKDMNLFWSYFSVRQVMGGDRLHIKVRDEGLSGSQAGIGFNVN